MRGNFQTRRNKDVIDMQCNERNPKVFKHPERHTIKGPRFTWNVVQDLEKQLRSLKADP